MKFVNKNSIIITFVTAGLFFQTSCKKFVEIGPPKTQLVTSSVFNSNSTATAALTAIYSKMFNDFTPIYVSEYLAMSADELTSYSTYQPIVQLYSNSLNAGSGVYQGIWNSGFNYIYQANAALEGIQNSSAISANVRTQLIGEAKFIRAYWHFYLVNLFGGIPIITSTDYRKNSVATRASKADVYSQIILDLTDAQNSLNSNFVDATDTTITTERVRPTKWAATALLARAYLYTGDWVKAEQQSTTVIGSSLFNIVPNLNSVFLKNSSEAIWQLLPVRSGYNTMEGQYFILTGAPNGGSGAQNSTVSNQLVSAFEINDNRKASWIGTFSSGTNTYYYPFKYKVASGSTLTEYSIVLRLAEQYLIRAEARAQQGNISGAQSDLNVIRNRAGLSNTTASTQSTLLSSILHERQVELFTEWGHRWLDLKRTNTIDAVMNVVTPIKGGIWNTNWQLYPIPQSEINTDPNLTQNTGY